jgi:hypothetical protein
LAEDYKTEVQALYDAIDSLSDEFNEYLNELCDKAALNWLRVYGIPQTPNDVWRIFNVLYQGIPANLIKDGKLIHGNGAVLASEDVQAERKAKREARSQLSLDDLFSKDEAPRSFGQYL